MLPLVPIVLGTALVEHRFGPIALAAGLSLSFVTVGLFVATVGFSIGLDGSAFRTAGAVLLVTIGIVLIVPRLQARVVLAGSRAGGWADARFGGFSTTGLWGQFGVGLLLGTVWIPCVGPTLGAASVLAAQGENLGAGGDHHGTVRDRERRPACLAWLADTPSAPAMAWHDRRGQWRPKSWYGGSARRAGGRNPDRIGQNSRDASWSMPRRNGSRI